MEKFDVDKKEPIENQRVLVSVAKNSLIEHEAIYRKKQKQYIAVKDNLPVYPKYWRPI